MAYLRIVFIFGLCLLVFNEADSQTVVSKCLRCICEASSNCNLLSNCNIVCGAYQITKPYWKEYVERFGKDCNGDGVTNCLDFATIHYFGGYSCDQELPENYAQKIKQCM